MATLEENITQAISDFDDIEAAIEEHGVDVPEGTDTSEYGNLIRSLPVGASITVDQTYDPESANALSGVAVAEAIAGLPIKYVESTSENILDLFSLESGTYVLKGSFRPYPNATKYLTFSKLQLVSVSKGSISTCVQVFYPPYNAIQYLNIWPDETLEAGYDYERKDAKLYYMEDTRNMTNTVDENSDDTHYPSSKAVYDAISRASAQSDLAVNDESDPSFVKNRTHYETTKEVVKEAEIVPEGTFEPDKYGNCEIAADVSSIVAGETYKVTYNGAVYECTPWYDDYGDLVFGNTDWHEGGEPFWAQISDGAIWLTTDDGESFTFSLAGFVNETVSEVKTLDPKYIEDMYYTEPAKAQERVTSITWDGNTSGLVETTLTTGSGPTHYKVADLPDGWDETTVRNLDLSKIKINGLVLSGTEFGTPNENEISSGCYGWRCFDIDTSSNATVTIVWTAGAQAWTAQLSLNGWLKYPEPGIYFSTEITSFECTEAVEIPEVVHRLKSKYIGAFNYEKILVEELTPDSDQTPSCTFIVKDAYDVVWNGVVYENVECVDNHGYRCLGGDDYPFYIDDDGGDGFYLEPEDSWETVTVIHKNSLNPIYLPEPLTDSGGTSAEWEQIANYSLVEATQTIESLWTATPMKRIKVELSTPAAAANTSYMPMRVYTGEDLLREYSFFYPSALPMNAATTMVYDISAQKIGENNVVEIEELKGNMTTGNKAFWVEATNKQISVGNSPYSTPNPTDTILGIYIQTYGSFDVGTTLKIWGTRA